MKIQLVTISLLLFFGFNSFANSDIAIPYKIATSGKSTCAITSKGVVCWGKSSKFSSLPEYPTGLVSPSEIVGFDWGSFCVIDGSQIKCWGEGAQRVEAMNIPTNLSHPHGLAIYDGNVCVIVDEGVRCWGKSNYIVSQVPNDLHNPKQVIIGAWEFACASTDKGVRCWGKRCNGFMCADLASIEALGKVKKLWNVGISVFALKEDNSLATGGWIVSYLQIPGDVKTAIDLAISGNTACALDDHRIRCWGNDGAYNGMDYSTLLQDVKELPLKGGHSLSISQDTHEHLCVLADAGVKCWGENDYTQTLPSNRVLNPKKIHVAHSNACVLNDSELSCWGGNGLSNRRHRPFYKTDLLYSTPASQIVDFSFSHDAYFDSACTIVGNEVRCRSWNYGENIATGNSPYAIWSGRGENRSIPFNCFADRDGLHCRGEYGSLKNFTQNVPTISEKIKKVIFAESSYQDDSACAFTSKSAYCWGTTNVNKLNFQSVTDAAKVFSTEWPAPWYICMIEDGARVKCGRPDQKIWGKVESIKLPTETPGAKYIAGVNMNEVCIGYSDYIDCWDTKLGVQKARIQTPKLQQIAMGHDSGSEWKDGAVCAIFNGGYDCWLTDGTKPNVATLNATTDWGMLTNFSPYTIQQF